MELALAVRDDVVNPAVIGAIQGAVYGLLGLGLVLLYKANRVFNFAQGEFGTVAALTTFALATGFGSAPKTPYAVAVLAGLAAGTVFGLATERIVARPLFHQPKVTTVVATAGVALFAIAIELMIFGTNPYRARPVVEGTVLRSGGLTVTKQQVIILAVLGALAVASALFFSRTQTGLAVIAVSQEPTATSLVGISVNRISALTWGLAGFLGGVAGILLAPNTLFQPAFMTVSALIPAFTAAVFGGITSLPGVFVGGVAIGVVEQVAITNVQSSVVPGAGRVVVFLLLLATLLLRPRGLLGKES